MNMWFFWIVAREMEPLYGSRDFLAFYLAAGDLQHVRLGLVRLAVEQSSYRDRGLGRRHRRRHALHALLPEARDVAHRHPDADVDADGDLSRHRPDSRSVTGVESNVAVEAHLAGAGFAFLFKQFDLRLSRLVSGRLFTPATAHFLAGPSRAEPVAVAQPVAFDRQRRRRPKSPSVSVLPEEQLDARLDEVLAKIAREGRSGLTEEELRVLQEASRRAASSGATGRERRHGSAPPLLIREAGSERSRRDRRVQSPSRARDRSQSARSRRPLARRRPGPRRPRSNPLLGRAISGSDGLAGQAAITREWSDWRNGWIWWFQSVYVAQRFSPPRSLPSTLSPHPAETPERSPT